MQNDTRDILKIGSKCRLSALGSKRCRRVKSWTGIIVGVNPTGSSFRIVLEGRRQPVTLHASYIEPDTPDVGAALIFSEEPLATTSSQVKRA